MRWRGASPARKVCWWVSPPPPPPPPRRRRRRRAASGCRPGARRGRRALSRFGAQVPGPRVLDPAVTLVLASELADGIRRHAEATYPGEAAGLLLGTVEDG